MLLIFEKALDKNPSWSNIEKLLRDYLISDKLNKNLFEDGTFNKNINLIDKHSHRIFLIIINRIFYILGKTFSQKSFYEFLMNQLNIFEDAFKKYMKKE